MCFSEKIELLRYRVAIFRIIISRDNFSWVFVAFNVFHLILFAKEQNRRFVACCGKLVKIFCEKIKKIGRNGGSTSGYRDWDVRIWTWLDFSLVSNRLVSSFDSYNRLFKQYVTQRFSISKIIKSLFTCYLGTFNTISTVDNNVLTGHFVIFL